MKIFNKLTAFLIVTSFILSGDVFAVSRDEGGRRAPTIKRSAKRTPSAIERNVRPAGKRTATRTSARGKPAVTRSRAGQAPGIRKSVVRRTTQSRGTSAATPRGRAVTRSQIPAQINRASTTRATQTRVASPRASQTRVASPTRTTQTRVASTTRATRNVSNTQIQTTEKTRTAKSTRGKVVTRQAPPENSKTYVLRTSDMTQDLRDDLTSLGYTESQETLSHQDVKEMMGYLATNESRGTIAPGTTERWRNFLKSKHGFQG